MKATNVTIFIYYVFKGKKTCITLKQSIIEAIL